MDRRDCLRWSGAAAVALALGNDAAIPVEAAPRRIAPALGVQMFAVREPMRRDPEGTLRALRGIGFRELEFFGLGAPSDFTPDPWFGLGLPRLKGLLDELGLTVPTVHFSAAMDAIPAVAMQARELGAGWLVQPIAADFVRRTPEGLVVSGFEDLGQVRRLADLLNQQGAACRAAGVGFAYHNHHFEFLRVEGRRGIDLLLAETDPALVKFELDLGWARVADADGVDCLERHAGRFVACHLKDFDPALPRGLQGPMSAIPQMAQLVPPGEGDMDFARIMRAVRRAGVEHGYIEVDQPRGDPVEACRRGYEHLVALSRRLDPGSETNR